MALDRVVKDSINAELKQQKMSQRQLARRCGFSQQYAWRRLSTAERADLEFTPSELEKIADVLGVPVSRFFPTPARAA